jgi:TatD DNase family protein
VIDTHAHLDAIDDDPADIVARARAAGVTRILTVGTTPAGCRRALELADTHEEVCAILGIHPHEAGRASHADIAEVCALLAHPKAVAVGETGLDWYREYAPRAAQLRLFTTLLDVASAVDKPAVIHTRAADADTVAALVGFEGRVVLHCFSSPPLLEVALARRWYVSFAGNATFPKAVDLRLAATQVPADRILAETDAPYLAPQPVRGRRNEPAYVQHTLSALARARGVETADLEARIELNARECFGVATGSPVCGRGPSAVVRRPGVPP